MNSELKELKEFIKTNTAKDGYTKNSFITIGVNEFLDELNRLVEQLDKGDKQS